MLNLFGDHLLSWITFSPLVVAALLVAIPNEQIARFVALGGSLLIFALSLGMYGAFDPAQAGFQFVVNRPWLPAAGIHYALGVDGISLFLVLLTTFLTPVIVAASWRSVHEGMRKFLFLILVLECTVLGSFLATDLFLFYSFWEAMLVPIFFLIGIWGGKERIYAATKFLLYNFAGSLPMLVAIIYLVMQAKVQQGAYSAGFEDLLKLNLSADGLCSPQGLIFCAFALSFLIKLPLFPFHTWTSDVYSQAPAGVVLGGIIIKLGGYGLIRFAMPLAAGVLPLVSPWMMGLGALTIVYGACVALAQDDMKKLVAYSTVSHMGYIVLGLFALNQIGVTGSLYQMINQGIATSALFLLVDLLFQQKHSREIKAFSGLAKTIPLFSIAMMIVTLSYIALPGTNGFVGEFLILSGGFLAQPWWAAVAGLGVILGAVYMLWFCQRILFGAPDEAKGHALHDLRPREMAYLAPLLVLVFFMGLYPKPFIRRMEPSIVEFTKRVSAGGLSSSPVAPGSAPTVPSAPSISPDPSAPALPAAPVAPAPSSSPAEGAPSAKVDFRKAVVHAAND